MPVLTPADTALAQWTFLHDAILSEQQSGRLTGLADVRKSLDFWTKLTPVAGVQITDWVTKDYASQRRQLFIDFTIRVAVHSVAVGTTPANGDDALAKLWALISDGTGNGFSEVLRDPANRHLGGNADEFNLIRITPQVLVDDGETGDVWAEAYITCRSSKVLAIV